ncbi:hypothetical protein WICPIJ_003154 [Wickerhamomyces pijperi]|uniref:Uncharacterized protein n=1 Tax=Wickerhamomyces pijperi TaxID=599730 RepID=A0A9P8TPH5_WICPI|nr:hypothetical protein WICPIJ_003154 [Wickerhamomyces pijperi]
MEEMMMTADSLIKAGFFGLDNLETMSSNFHSLMELIPSSAILSAMAVASVLTSVMVLASFKFSKMEETGVTPIFSKDWFKEVKEVVETDGEFKALVDGVVAAELMLVLVLLLDLVFKFKLFCWFMY